MRNIDSFHMGPISAYRFGYHPFAKPTLQVILYYLDGLLIDVGQSRCRKPILDTTRTFEISQIYITHHHEDHTGNLTEMVTQHQCHVYGSHGTATIMRSPPAISFSQWAIWGGRKPFNEIIPIERELETENYLFQIIDIPGHTSDMTALYMESEGILFSSDLYLNSYIGYYLWSESMKQQIESISKVLKLDFDTLLCAHNPKITNGKGKLSQKLQFLQDFYGEVERCYNEGMKEKEIFMKMRLKEAIGVKILSGGMLSQINMVRSVIRDINNTNTNVND